MSTKFFERGKVFIGMIMGMGLLFCGHNSVKAVQEEYTAGSSIKTEYEGEVNYDEDIQTYSSGEILAQSASGWRKDNNGWWYQYSDGSYPAGKWMQDGKKRWYYFNKNGYMVTGSQYIDGNWYYFAGDGEMLTGWQHYSDGWWYHNSNGAWVSSNYADNTIKGIDVSYYQGNIDWNAVKNDGIQFAILRVSAGYYSDSYHHFTDKRFKEYAANANSVGMPIGAYIYSKARTTENAVSDARYVINELKGYTISYPVAIDLEDSSQTDLSRQQLGAIAKTFCNEIRKAGYTPMVYCNENWYKNYIDVSQISNEEMWVARYNYHYNTDIHRAIWQSGSTCRISGISGNVDIDFAIKVSSGWKYTNGAWYYLGVNGQICKGWIKDNGKWYYLNSEGQMQKGWLQLGNRHYYLNNSGEMQKGWQKINDKWYYMNSNGVRLTGWQKVGRKWYFMNWNGEMHIGWLQTGNTLYYLNYNGEMHTGWLRSEGHWYYMNSNGVRVSGWQKVGNTWYLMDNNGVMLTGWQKVGNTWYLMNGSGAMLTDWQKVGGKWYLMNSNGAMLTGWQKVGGKWYFLNWNGEMLTGRHKIGNKWCYLNSSGEWVY